MSLTIIFDADDVLVDSSTPGILRYNEEYGENLIYEDIINYIDDKFFPEGKSIEKYYDEPGFYRTFIPFDGAQQTVSKLVEDGHRLFIATASDLNAFFDKMGCYDEHFPEFSSDKRNVIPIKDKYLLIGDVIIDDMVYNLTNSPCPLKLLVDRPWNRAEVGDFVRVFTWDQLYQEIKSLASLNELSLG